MARLRDYLKNLQDAYKPQPVVDEDTEQKAEAFDYLRTGQSADDEE